MASTSGRNRLADYLEDILERTSADSFTPDAEELRTKIMPSVVKSIRRLLSGAPEEMVANVKEELTTAGVMPDFQADLSAFRGALKTCLEKVSAYEVKPDSSDGETEKKEEEEGEKKEETHSPPKAQRPPEPTPSEEELKSFAAVVSRLWEIDTPWRMEEGTHFKLNLQSRASGLDSLTDRCPEPLFTHVDQAKLHSFPTGSAFAKLLDNYERDSEKAEIVSNIERREMDSFIRLLMNTPHMRYTHKVLVAWGLANPDPRRFAVMVYDMWFTTYSLHHGQAASSSGFEHVFVGEEKRDPKTGKEVIIGFHNWLRFWSQEMHGKVDYRGYSGHAGGSERVVSVRFEFEDDDAVKPISTFIVGSTIAFEMAMLTVAFIGFKGECNQGGIWLGDVGPLSITTYSWTTSLGMHVRSAFIGA